MDILFFAAFVAPVVALVERNHRRNTGLPSTVLGAAHDRDLDRVRHDLAAAAAHPPADAEPGAPPRSPP